MKAHIYECSESNNPNIATFIDSDNGLAVTITNTKRGFCVTFLDADALEIIATRFYPHDKKLSAIAYAKGLIGC